MEKDPGKNKFSELRKKAQAFLASKPEKASEKADIYRADVRQLIHELDTYQIELELQNEDLRTAQHELERSHRRYADFYDFAPVAFITANDKGLIIEANCSNTCCPTLSSRMTRMYSISAGKNYWRRYPVERSRRKIAESA